jgi:hypothetical protein
MVNAQVRQDRLVCKELEMCGCRGREEEEEGAKEAAPYMPPSEELN